MSHYSSVFSRVPIELPNRSGFDMSHENLGTATTGTLVPVLVDELLPNDTVSLGASFQVQLPPMATDFYGRVDFVLEAFFVPSRLLWGGWQSFMTHPTANPQYPAGTPVQGRSRYMPLLRVDRQTLTAADTGFPFITEDIKLYGAGTLADYLGFKSPSVVHGLNSVDVNALPFLAYHRIWDDHYRDSRLQAPLFYRPDSNVSAGDLDIEVAYRPYTSGGVDSASIIEASTPYAFFTPTQSGANGHVMCLRQRNWAKDYFTTASTLPQAGNAATVTFNVSVPEDSTTGSGNFSISTLRAANSMQKWMERNNIMGYRYSDQIYGQYGIYPSDAIMDKCIYLGRKTQNVYTRSVFQTASSSGVDKNVFQTVGSKFGSSQAIGEGSLFDEIRVTEHGFLMVLASLVPHAYYSSGIRRYLNRRVVGDIAFPLLSGIGDQAIKVSELCPIGYDATFGYTDRYAEYKYHDDEVHGLLQDGESLSAFALQRSFPEIPQLGSDFLQIPKDYLDQVMSVATSESGYSCWYDIYFPYKKVSTLPEYSLPTLADLKHVHTEYASRGGKRL